MPEIIGEPNAHRETVVCESCDTKVSYKLSEVQQVGRLAYRFDKGVNGPYPQDFKDYHRLIYCPSCGREIALGVILGDK